MEDRGSGSQKQSTAMLLVLSASANCNSCTEQMKCEASSTAQLPSSVNPKSQVSSICATICVEPIRHTMICTILYSIQSAAPSKFLLGCHMCHEASICIHHLTIKLNPCPNYVQDSKISKPWASTHLSAAPRWFDSQHLREPGTTPVSSTALETDAASKTWCIKIWHVWTYVYNILNTCYILFRRWVEQ